MAEAASPEDRYAPGTLYSCTIAAGAVAIEFELPDKRGARAAGASKPPAAAAGGDGEEEAAAADAGPHPVVQLVEYRLHPSVREGDELVRVGERDAAQLGLAGVREALASGARPLCLTLRRADPAPTAQFQPSERARLVQSVSLLCAQLQVGQEELQAAVVAEAAARQGKQDLHRRNQRLQGRLAALEEEERRGYPEDEILRQLERQSQLSNRRSEVLRDTLAEVKRSLKALQVDCDHERIRNAGTSLEAARVRSRIGAVRRLASQLLRRPPARPASPPIAAFESPPQSPHEELRGTPHGGAQPRRRAVIDWAAQLGLQLPDTEAAAELGVTAGLLEADPWTPARRHCLAFQKDLAAKVTFTGLRAESLASRVSGASGGRAVGADTLAAEDATSSVSRPGAAAAASGAGSPSSGSGSGSRLPQAAAAAPGLASRLGARFRSTAGAAPTPVVHMRPHARRSSGVRGVLVASTGVREHLGGVGGGGSVVSSDSDAYGPGGGGDGWPARQSPWGAGKVAESVDSGEARSRRPTEFDSVSELGHALSGGRRAAALTCISAATEPAAAVFEASATDRLELLKEAEGIIQESALARVRLQQALQLNLEAQRSRGPPTPPSSPSLLEQSLQAVRGWVDTDFEPGAEAEADPPVRSVDDMLAATLRSLGGRDQDEHEAKMQKSVLRRLSIVADSLEGRDLAEDGDGAEEDSAAEERGPPEALPCPIDAASIRSAGRGLERTLTNAADALALAAATAMGVAAAGQRVCGIDPSSASSARAAPSPTGSGKGPLVPATPGTWPRPPVTAGHESSWWGLAESQWRPGSEVDALLTLNASLYAADLAVQSVVARAGGLGAATAAAVLDLAPAVRVPNGSGDGTPVERVDRNEHQPRGRGRDASGGGSSAGDDVNEGMVLDQSVDDPAI